MPDTAYSSYTKHLLALITGVCALLASPGLSAQELDCQVSVIAPTVNNVETSVFNQLETAITEFMSGRRWTSDEFTLEERITCTMQITINKANSQTNFEATIQVQSSRPTFNSDYNAPVLMVNDNDFDFTYAPGTLLQYSQDQFRDNLTSVLAFYAYLILAMDYDTFSLGRRHQPVHPSTNRRDQCPGPLLPARRVERLRRKAIALRLD